MNVFHKHMLTWKLAAHFVSWAVSVVMSYCEVNYARLHPVTRTDTVEGTHTAHRPADADGPAEASNDRHGIALFQL